MKITSLFGRVLFALSFIAYGINHFRQTAKAASYIPDYIPFPEIWVYATGAIFILAGISMAINYKARIAGFALASIILVFILILYLPNLAGSKMAITTYAAFIGASLFIAGNSKA
ncbi:MAG: DoxX family membrane protein [Bacteroidetes bacterium]|jgi:putative oxidoreductase|nr:DoxX family membrane protein [Bacteroidota bacterium]MBT5528063.1 DoxX family membrane protein [Cytophagia bacterium]MBT3424337.1 DoxX family membrane protein [Bacteroidota bacterium]MBT3801920.1 DoxX family membrane protein [Bacteroidota bacterium]MBT3934192.1 DoxX family membrane protein [Bacteroidota bacterium]